MEVYLRWDQVALLGAKVFLVASSSLLLVSAYQPVWAQSLLGEETKIIQLTNGLRQKQGLPLLVKNEKLATSAFAKASDMAVNSYFGHADKNGNRMAYWIFGVGYDYLRAGENLAKGFSDPQELIQAWVSSSTHYANLVNTHYQETGVGIAQGYIDGRFTTFIVQHFGEPMPNINLVPVNIAKSNKSVMGDSLPSTIINNNNQILIAPSWQSDSRNESAIINTSPAGLLWVAYQDTKNILQQSVLPVSLAAGVADVGLPQRGYQVAQILFMVLAFLGIWGWLSMLMWPVYVWLRKLKK